MEKQMNAYETLNKLVEMKFTGMAQALKTSMETGRGESYTADELVAFLVDSEWEERQNKRLDRLVKKAKFRYFSTFEELSFNMQRSLDKNLCLRLSTGQFIKKGESVLITGPTGVGKSFLASALGNQACVKGYKVLYFNMGKLFDQLRIFQADGSYAKEVEKIAKTDLLILDDFGMKSFNNQQRMMLMEIIEDRHGRASTIITSQHPVKNWYEIIGEATLADAILDRLVHSAHEIKISGESMRKKHAKKIDFKEK